MNIYTLKTASQDAANYRKNIMTTHEVLSSRFLRSAKNTVLSDLYLMRSAALRASLRRKEIFFSSIIRHDFATLCSLRSRRLNAKVVP
jgi:hypothetical protein